jgi:hypothetical protein
LRANLALWNDEDRRRSERFPVALPASVCLGAAKHTAKLINIVSGGAMLETRVELDVSAALVVSCGTINARATVVWTEGDRAGVKFVHPLSEAEVNEQVSRCAALESRRRIRAV